MHIRQPQLSFQEWKGDNSKFLVVARVDSVFVETGRGWVQELKPESPKTAKSLGKFRGVITTGKTSFLLSKRKEMQNLLFMLQICTSKKFYGFV